MRPLFFAFKIGYGLLLGLVGGALTLAPLGFLIARWVEIQATGDRGRFFRDAGPGSIAPPGAVFGLFVACVLGMLCAGSLPDPPSITRADEARRKADDRRKEARHEKNRQKEARRRAKADRKRDDYEWD